MTTKYLAKFQSPRAITRPKIIGPQRNVNLICNLSLYTHIPNIKSISQSIAKKGGRNCFISELQTWITLYMSRPLSGEDIIKWHSKQIMNGLKRSKNVHDIFYQKVSCFHHDIYMYEKIFI